VVRDEAGSRSVAGIVLGYADPRRELAGVRLVQEIGLPTELCDFYYDPAGPGWRLPLPPVAVRRMEYRLELRRPDGSTTVLTDPDNPLVAPGAFGDKSVLELPGYRRPEWLDRPAVPGSWQELTVPSRALGAELPVRIWTPAAAETHGIEARGILLAHDGGEFDRLASLGHYCASMVAAGELPPHHLVLLSPVARNDWYSANPAYAKALVNDVIPTVRQLLRCATPLVALGASLGGLALLHAQHRYPPRFAGLFLQSGSFFQDRFDSQERDFPPYRRIVRFVAMARRRRTTGVPVPTVLTCGAVEENLANNRDMADALRRQRYPVRLVEVPDAHNFIAWRDAWHPHLATLARGVWTPDPLRG
jgi:enterochelin esterase-like enzyme